jgi:hypothetical protein
VLRPLCLWRQIVLLVFLVVSAGGCGNNEPIGKVSGKVTFGGAPIAEGTIEFAKADYAADVPLKPDGTYQLDNPGLPPGDYMVAIHPAMVPDPRDDPEKTPPGSIEKNDPNIPKKYRSLSTTDLTAKVLQGKNTFDFELK